MGGRDPVIIRRLGQAEQDAVVVNLGVNYHLDSYLDEDMKRFAVEFPQCFQVGLHWPDEGRRVRNASPLYVTNTQSTQAEAEAVPTVASSKASKAPRCVGAQLAG